MIDLLVQAQETKCSVFDDYVPIIKEDKGRGEYHVYLFGEIIDPANYAKLVHLLSTAKSYEVFNIHLNTPGGMMDSGITIRNAISASNAKTVAKLSGTVASAGTMIALSCDEIEVTSNLAFMCHEVSISNMAGKFSDIKNTQNFYEKSFSRMSNDIYSGFLSDDEISEMHSGKELWMDEKEVLERWYAKKSLPILQLPEADVNSNTVLLSTKED